MSTAPHPPVMTRFGVGLEAFRAARRDACPTSGKLAFARREDAEAMRRYLAAKPTDHRAPWKRGLRLKVLGCLHCHKWHVHSIAHQRLGRGRG